jgi:hypothetical protein
MTSPLFTPPFLDYIVAEKTARKRHEIIALSPPFHKL